MSDLPLARRGRRSALIGACLVGALLFGAVTAPAADVHASAPMADPECTVSDLLVPSCGAWLGASTPSSDGKFDYDRGLDEYEAVAHNVPDILHFYKTDAASFPTADEVSMSQRSGGHDSLLYYNWKPSTSLTWRQVADGAADDNIQLVATSLQRYPGRLFLSIFHEPENDQGGAGSGRTPADYVAMFRHVVTTLRAEGVTNAVFVMNFMGFEAWSSVADEFYPGADVVDWIAYDPYAFAKQPTFASLLNRAVDGVPGFYDWAVARAPGKPIMLGEWGFDLTSQPAAPAALGGAVSALKSQFPMVKALVYWNDRTDVLDYRLDQQTELGAVYGSAYSRMANDSFFNSTSVEAAFAAPVIDIQTAPVGAQQANGSDDAGRRGVLRDGDATPASSILAVLGAALVGLVLVRRQRRALTPRPDDLTVDRPSSGQSSELSSDQSSDQSSVEADGVARRRVVNPDSPRRLIVRPDQFQRGRSTPKPRTAGTSAVAVYDHDADGDDADDDAIADARTSQFTE
ncbi:MAG: hypothetical protein JWN99_2869 [Ilumatobacteraceae bacterium]|nr:hypothetical protein [Ilumatobacteraceae bacterium]